ncbi:MAG: DegV family protein [Ruthenibacterium sp.]
MSKVAILTDSACDLTMAMQEKYKIDILPFLITVDGKGYVEREDFTPEQYYEILTKCTGIPSTAQITMMRFAEQYAKYDAAGFTDVIYIGINASASGTFNAATMAISDFKEEFPDSKMRIHLVDSHTYSMTYGKEVCEAARKLQNGAAVPDVLSYLEQRFACLEIVLSVFTLKFVKKSGRVSAAAAFAGELLGLRPIISMIDGVTATVSKVRGDGNVMPALVAYAKKRMLPGTAYQIGTTDMENGKMLAKLCKKEFGTAPDTIFLLGAAIATNTGPNAVAIVFDGESRR